VLPAFMLGAAQGRTESQGIRFGHNREIQFFGGHGFAGIEVHRRGRAGKVQPWYPQRDGL